MIKQLFFQPSCIRLQFHGQLVPATPPPNPCRSAYREWPAGLAKTRTIWTISVSQLSEREITNERSGRCICSFESTLTRRASADKLVPRGDRDNRSAFFAKVHERSSEAVPSSHSTNKLVTELEIRCQENDDLFYKQKPRHPWPIYK